jgi:acetylornithine deacetylase/succinyl-diaminopimelate desuccinylase-like protein
MKFSRSFYLVVAAAALLAGAAIAWSIAARRDAPDEATYVPKPVKITPEIELLQRYLRIDTSNPPGNETAGARFLVDELLMRGIRAELIESAPGRGNVYARLKGRRSGEGLLLLHHIDVVPASPEGWKAPPFAGALWLDMLVGRGALDMKSVGIAQLEAFTAVARAGRPPERDVVFLAVADEETGGKLGTAWLLEHRPDVFEGIRYALNEGGVTEMDREQVSYFAIETGTKQFVELRAHAPARDALERARIALEPWIDPFDVDAVTPELRQYFRTVAPIRRVGEELFNDVDGAVEKGKVWNLAAPYRALAQNTLGVYAIEPETGGFAMRVVMHNLPQADPWERIAWLRKTLAPYRVTVEVRDVMGPTRVSSTATPFYRLLVEEARAIHKPTRIGSLLLPWATNDSRYLRARGIHAYGIWPFKVDYFQTIGIHAVDERIRLDWFVEGVDLTRSVVDRYAFADTF